MSTYIAPDIETGAFTCPHCGAYAQQDAIELQAAEELQRDQWRYDIINQFAVTVCAACERGSVWCESSLVWPTTSGHAPMPNPDLPEAARKDYLEARSIAGLSPRGAAALLRLAIQRLCNSLLGKETGINDAIGELVKRGLDERVQ